MKERIILKLPKHCNPTPNRTASAPYNFIPLPETVVLAVDDAKDLPDHDRYEQYSGYFDVVLTTKSPLYIRCPFSLKDFLKMEQEEDLPFRDQVKNTPHFFYTIDPSQPVIPGSSLRGMLRNLLEIVSYSKINRVTDTKIFYRAVGAKNDDPLKKPYTDIIKNVKAGYLKKKIDGWYVKPAKRPADMGWPEKGSFIKVKADDIPKEKIQGFMDFNTPGYRPQYHEVSFDIKIDKKQGKKYLKIIDIASREAGYPYKGYLVCSGNMMESSDGGKKSPRKYCTLVLEEDEKAKEIKINEQSIKDYLDSLTPFQKEKPFDEKMGCLVENRPIFYVERDNEVFFFGHCPNFRVPAFDENEKRANSPLDFVPKELRNSDDIDYAEAIFGFVRENNNFGDKKQAYASRVFVTDAVLEEGQNDIWLSEHPIVPKILASPKPTTFPHYLVQPNCEKILLKHYGNKNETVIRGFKRYWLQGERNVNHIIENDPQWLENGQVKKDSKQHTQIRPIKPSVRFRFRVYFENLSDRELGAICWILNPLGDPKKEYCHQLGMGKPLGMGAVKLEATLYTIDRKKRYSALFNENEWETGISAQVQKLSDRQTLEKLTSEFEKHILSQLSLDQKCKHLSELKRIAMLLKMMEWPGFPPVSNEELYLKEYKRPNTRYMRIRDKNNRIDEYKDRRVLPDPSAFGKLTGNEEPEPTENCKNLN